MPRFAAEHGLPVFTGHVKTPEFFEIFLDNWQPQLCLMATFGKKIPTALFNYPRLGFFNFHHSGVMPHAVLCRTAGELLRFSWRNHQLDAA